ncbi:putative transcriptional regulator [Moraxella catarrhalis]|uniref:helix-turn-helix domain-containing protein n=1 Tax=Moraxella catarrhalis TaxID=480 RepID=UPI0007E49A9C|nr:helix-turn-helix transcriptional regulator [Moraxella catarrhalis]OAV06975.1 putative transcriptional regulator [Moraxella catarrhalis]OAV13137.1 putative transcriptional regulator [Moraxella catarrhalis]OAV17176.1 putative transcriptional regulator [Moraxella catarrhalis]OAV31424.1 putative transcriptional regulator [Moraxella catarrhalis]
MIKCNLILLLAERRLKVADAVRQTGISKTTLHKIYKDESTQIDFETIDKLCGFLGITMGEIFEYVPDAPVKH